MALNAVRFLNLLLAGVLTGNEFGGLVGFHVALYELPTEAHARAERAITSRGQSPQASSPHLRPSPKET